MPKPPSRPDADDDLLPPPRASLLRIAGRVALVAVFGLWSLLLFAWLTLHWGILPNARAWLPQIEQQASRALGMPVRIGDIRVRSSGWVPALELDDVVLLDAEGREALRLPRVAAAPAARSLLALELQLQQLHVEGAQVELRRDAHGRLHLAGFDLAADAAAGADGAFAAWLLRQREVVLRGARLRWVDELRLAPPLALEAVDLVLRNRGRRHELRVDATPPHDWGQRFTLRAKLASPLLGRRDDWQRLGGEVYAELPRIDAGALRRYVDLPFEWRGGQGALRGWAQFAQGEPVSATVDLAFESVALRLAPTVEPLQLQRIFGRLTARRDDDALTLAASDFGFTDAAGREWPAGRLHLALRQRRGDAPTGGEFRADRLDLALMAAVAAHLPLGDAVGALLAELQPGGRVEQLDARWDGPLDAPRQYRVRAELHDLSLAARPAPDIDGRPTPGRPGWRGARIELDANEQGGQAQIAFDRGALLLPGVFADPELPLRRLAARLDWQIEPRRDAAPQLTLRVRDARFANADARGGFDAVWRSGDGEGFGRGARFPGRLELAGRIDEGRADAVARYLPLGLPAVARDYVSGAVRGGTIGAARFEVRGDLWDFPFHDGSDGEFRIAGRAQGLTLAYVPDVPGFASEWPAFTEVSGEIEFRRASMAVRNAGARVFGLAMSGVHASIADLTHHPVLLVEGTARGPASGLLRYLDASPVGGWIDDTLAGASVAGDGELQLAIRLPLDDLHASGVRGSLRLEGNDLRLAPSLPLLAAARGHIDFTHEGFRLRDASARVFGGEATFDGGRGADGLLQLLVQGRARADAMRQSRELPALAQLATRLDGEAAYRLQLDWRRDDAEPALVLSSDLVGLALRLPAPLDKAAAASLPLRYSVAPQQPAGRDELRVDLGTVLQARFEREFDAGGRVTVRRGGIGVGAPAPWPASGVAAVATLAQLDVPAWQAVLAAVGGAQGGGGYAPRQVALRADELRADGRRLSGVVAGLSQAPGGTWRASVEADQLAGYLEWQPPSPAAPGGLRARLSRLALPRSDEAQVETLLDRAPQRVPALDVVVDRFELRGRQLGRLEVEAVNRALPGGAHEWRLSTLRLANDDAAFSAAGHWRPAGPREPARMVADFGLDLADAGALLARLGLPDALQGGAGRLEGQVSWQGSPLAPHPPSMDGRMQLALEKGRFLKAEPGAARLLSVLSLQALPRRLVLDFRDLFQEGFAFDDVAGDVTVRAGVARTENLRMRGLQAAVLMQGEADLARETQDLRVIVVPEINAGTASLVYSLINPAVGLGSFVAQLFLRQPLMAAGTREFHVHGSWADPKVDRVERTAEAPPRVDEPAAATTPAQ
ncbi:MAG: YhdP family protein [Gammaproteobacteria bacterium]